jgi:hypothetical protein
MFSFEMLSLFAIVFASDTSLADAFASPLLYLTCLKYTVQLSQSPVLYPQSSTFCVDPSSACDASSTSSVSASSPSSHSYRSISLFHRLNLLCPQSSTFCFDPSSAYDSSSSSSASASASSRSSPSDHSTSVVPRWNLSSSVAGRHHQLAMRMASRLSLSSRSCP